MDIFNNLCRACNTESPNLLNIFNNQEQYAESVTLKTMLEYCLQTALKNEVMYPNEICYFCVKQLEISYRFLQRFKLAQNEFEEAYKHVKGMNTKPEVDVKDICQVIEEAVVQGFEEVDQEGKLGKESVFLPQYFQRIKNECVTLNATTENIETNMEMPVEPTIKDEAKTCSICNKTFFTTKAHNLHLKLAHKRSKTEHNDSMENQKKIKIETSESNINIKQIEPVISDQVMEVSSKSDFPAQYCSICNKSFFTTKALNLHLKFSHKQKITLT